MKKLLILLLFVCAIGWSQDRPIRADVIFMDTLTTTERDALTMRPGQFALIVNSTVDSVQVWNGVKWSSLGSGGVLIDASGFNGNLSTADDTVQEVAQAFDDLNDTTLDSPYTPTNYTRASSTVRGQLQGIDAALGSLGGGTGYVTADSSFASDNKIIKSDGTGKGVQATGINIDDSNNITGVGNLDMNTNSINNASSITLSGWASPLQVRFSPNNTIGNTVDRNSVGFKTNNVFYLQKVNEINELEFNFNALTADRTITFPDANIDLSTGLTDDQTADEVAITGGLEVDDKGYDAVDVLEALSRLAASKLDSVVLAGTDLNFYGLGSLDHTIDLSGISGGGGTPDDDSVTAAKMADDDHGAFTYSTNVATLDANSVGSSQITDGSIGQLDIATAGVGLTNMAASSVGTSQLVTGSVSLAKLNSTVYPSQAQAEAGTENTTLMTPLRTAQAIAALAGAGATDSGQTKTYETGSSETLTLSSFLDSGSLTGRAKVVAHTANDTITTATGLGQTGRYISALHLLNGADSVYIKNGSGATLINRTIAYNGSGVSEDGIWATTDFILSVRPDGAIEVDGSDTFLAHTEVTDAMLHANLAIRLDETSIDPTAVSEGDPVGTWTDVVSGHNATSSGANRPSLHIVSGQRTVSFDGTDEFLGIAAANVNYTSGDVVTIMIELADIVPDNNVGTNYILSKAGFNQTTNHQYTIWSSSNVTRFNAFGNPATTSTDFTTNMVLTLNIKATTFDAWMNGTKVISGQALTNSATFSADLILGGNNAGLDNNGTFSMQGMYIYEGGLNDTEITDRVTYLNSN